MASLGENHDVRRTRLEGGGVQITVSGGRKTVERIVPPAGERYAFDVDHWSHAVTVYVSPTGRSVRLWIDGVEHKLGKPRR